MDCDDGDATVNPSATEVCDGFDNDCDGERDPAGCNPEDIDHDGLNNTDEEALCQQAGLDEALCPGDPDVDRDGVIDPIEVGADLSSPKDTDNDGRPDFDDQDDDADGPSTLVENGVDCAGELLPIYEENVGYFTFACDDGVEYDLGGNDLNDYPDDDEDGTPNFLDADDSNESADTGGAVFVVEPDPLPPAEEEKGCGCSGSSSPIGSGPLLMAWLLLRSSSRRR